MGAGQPNRVNSARLAIEQAQRQFGEAASDQAQGAEGVQSGSVGCVAASDAFIPFPDTVEVLAAAGVKAIIQPGGSIRDEEVLAAAETAQVAMIFTGKRHFRH
jgi:phosphoribosylaminoimidazolecarboxamide formyltransferase/IMP cyclohydrolase